MAKFIPSYLYEQYADDANVQAFVSAFNDMGQEYLDYLDDLGLPIYSGLSGDLLDWVGLGVYDVQRPVLPFGRSTSDGLYAALAFATLAYAKTDITNSGSFSTDDDTYKRVITWHVQKGDGRQFTIPWLKRRVKRFLVGVDGTCPNIDETYDISVTFSGPRAVVVDVPSSYDKAAIFQAAVEAGVLETPFQYSFTVNLV